MTTRTRLSTLARDIMSSPPIAIQADASLADAAKLMLEHNIGAVPVVTADGRLVGMVTERIFQADLAGIRPTSSRSFQERTVLKIYSGELTETSGSERAVFSDRKLPVGDVGVTDVAVVREDDPVWRVSQEMLDKHASHAVVVRGEDEAVGVIARHDLMKLFAGDAG